jgi:hypothetical protein
VLVLRDAAPEPRRSILTPGKMMISPSVPSEGRSIVALASAVGRNCKMVAILGLHGRMRFLPDDRARPAVQH